MKTTAFRMLFAGIALLLATAVPVSIDASDRDILRKTKGTYMGIGSLRIGGESIHGDTTITIPLRRGRLVGRIDPGGANEKFSGRINKVVCRSRVVVYYGKLRFQEGGISVTGNFKGRARLRGDKVKLSIPFAFSKDLLVDTIHVYGRIKGTHN